MPVHGSRDIEEEKNGDMVMQTIKTVRGYVNKLEINKIFAGFECQKNKKYIIYDKISYAVQIFILHIYKQ